MAYVKPAIQISLNHDKSYTVFINKECMKKDEDNKRSYSEPEDIVLSAMNTNDLKKIIDKYIPKLILPKEDKLMEEYFDSED